MGIDFTVFKGSKEGKVIKTTTSKQDLSGDEVLVKVTHSGLCGTDLHYKTTDMVLGHEGVGVVAQVADDVIDLKVGDRIGWGYEHDSCGRCQQCLSGHEQYCAKRHMYGMTEFDQGSLASHAVWREAFLFKIPDAMASEDAAPLMCGGATVFTPLNAFVKSSDRVGIIGVGGLGHLAIQFAAKMGCEVVVFSGTDSKREEATKLGAKEFVPMKGRDKLDLEHKIDHLLVTTSEQPDWSMYLPAMTSGGTIYPLTVSMDNLSIPSLPFIVSGICLQGSIVAPRHVHRKMLAFAAFHGIKPILMKFPLDESGIEEAIKTLEDGKMRYRGLLVAK